MKVNKFNISFLHDQSNNLEIEDYLNLIREMMYKIKLYKSTIEVDKIELYPK